MISTQLKESDYIIYSYYFGIVTYQLKFTGLSHTCHKKIRECLILRDYRHFQN
nr:MAG TPA: hypothetical protein [Caudoviricetes sp.]